MNVFLLTSSNSTDLARRNKQAMKTKTTERCTYLNSWTDTRCHIHHSTHVYPPALLGLCLRLKLTGWDVVCILSPIFPHMIREVCTRPCTVFNNLSSDILQTCTYLPHSATTHCCTVTITLEAHLSLCYLGSCWKHYQCKQQPLSREYISVAVDPAGRIYWSCVLQEKNV